jgi:hypothetical protein
MSLFKSVKIFTTSPILGYGYDLGEFWETINNEKPDAIILDAGSTDPGPFMLGSGKTLCSEQSYKRDLAPILEACSIYGIKLLIGSAGGAGTNEQVDFTIRIIQELADEGGWLFKIAAIKFKDDRNAFLSKLQAGKVRPCGPAPQLMADDICDATTIVAQMGAEPFQEALKDPSIDIIVAGRSYDPAPFAAFSMHHGVDQRPSWHVGKIIECGGLFTLPKGRSILATMYKDSFKLTPTNASQRCTPVSVAAHTLYEKTRADRLPGPGGVLHLDNATYQQDPDGRSVIVKGSTFVPSSALEIKLEGAQHIGFRTAFIGGIRDPILISGIDDFLDTVKTTTKAAFPDLDTPNGPLLIFHIYGKNAVMGVLEPSTTTPHEIGLLGEAFAQTQELASAISGFARTVVLHGAYSGQKATAGNLASPLTPLDMPLGPVYKFSVYHLMVVEDPASLFPIDILTVGKKGLPAAKHPLAVPRTVNLTKGIPTIPESSKFALIFTLKFISP